MIGKAAGAALWIAALGLLAAACTSSKPGVVVTVTYTPPASSTSASSATSSSSASSSSPTASPTGMTSLNGTCDTLLPDFDVFQAIGGKTPAGKDVFVVGKAEPDISRLAYINCRYGVTSPSAVPAIEIGVSLYQTDANAQDRIAATVDDYTSNHSATSTNTTVDKLPATMLTGGKGAGYDVPTLVVASGQRTVAVSIASSVATGSKAQSDAIAIAKLALDRTAA